MKKIPKSSIGKAVYVVSHMKKLWIVYTLGLAVGATVWPLYSWAMSRILKALVVSAQNPSLELFMRNIGGAALFCIAVLILDFLAFTTRTTPSAIGRRNFRLTLVDRLLNAKTHHLLSRHSGEWVTIAVSHSNKSLSIMENALGWVASTMITPITAAAIVLPVCWPMAAASFIMGLFMLFVQLWFAPRIRKVVAEENKQTELMTARFSDMMTGYPVIRGFGMYDRVKARFDKARDACYHWMMKWARLASVQSAVQWLFWNSITGVTLLVGMYCVNIGFVSLANMLGVWLVCNSFANSIASVGNAWMNLQEQLASFDRVIQLLELPQEESGTYKGEVNSDCALNVKDVSFRYPDNDQEVLNGFNLTLHHCDTLAFVGGSGGGKSTLVKLMLRLYDADEGVIEVFGKPVGEWDLESLRSRIAVVPQSPHLFDGTVSENIEMGRPGATQEEIMEAAKRANAHEFITEFTDGYQTLVGERGVQLSGGQKQRIAIARAFLKDAPILALDEATASLDGESEKAVTQALHQLMEGRTVILIAHRLSTAREVSQIAVIENGRIIEYGTHEELLDRNERYAQLWHLQSSVDVAAEA